MEGRRSHSAHHGCKWRGLPKRFGDWHTVYTRMSRWAKPGVLDKAFKQLQRAQVVQIKIEAVSLDSTSVQVHPDGTGGRKHGPPTVGKSGGGWNTKIPLVAAGARTAMTFSPFPGQTHDAPEGRESLKRLGPPSRPLHLIMDRAYGGNETRQLAIDLGFVPVVAPMRTRIEPREYDRAMYRRRNEVERLFRRLTGYRRIFSRFEKLDVMFIAFISCALIADGLRLC